MKCPSCSIELKMSERQGIEIDYCPQCRGVWLDRGELDKIIERSASESNNPPQRHDNDRQHEKEKYDKEDKHNEDDKYYKTRKRKSFLGDMFDF